MSSEGDHVEILQQIVQDKKSADIYLEFFYVFCANLKVQWSLWSNKKIEFVKHNLKQLQQGHYFEGLSLLAFKDKTPSFQLMNQFVIEPFHEFGLDYMAIKQNYSLTQ